MKRYRIEFLGVLLLMAVVGCGGGGGSERAPLDAQITGPKDSSTTIATPGGGDLIYKDLVFRVKNAALQPIPGVEISFVAGSVNMEGSGITDRNKNLLNPKDARFYKTTTDESGAAIMSLLILLPLSTKEEQKGTAFVTASVGSAEVTWTTEITVQKLPDAVATPTPTPTPVPTP